MKTFALLTLAAMTVLTVVLISNPQTSEEIQFQDFLDTYRVGYTNTNEYEYRLSVFSANLQKIQELNQDSTATFGVNQFADRTSEEMKSSMGFKDDFKSCPDQKEDNTNAQSVDWTSLWAHTKNQASCGSCWAFSAIGSFESRYALAQGQSEVTTFFSEQQLVDCDNQSAGCNGGLMDLAFSYLDGHNLCTEEEYSYHARASKCKDTSCTGPTVVHEHYCYDLASDAESVVTELQNGPVSIAVDATAWQFYKGGVMDAKKCNFKGLDHGVTLVAADVDAKSVTVRNSWGDNWGESGYIRLSMDDNACGWTNDASVPNIAA